MSTENPLNQHQFDQLLANEIETMCKLALQEDLAGKDSNDITAELIDAKTQANATLITRESGIFCGKAWVNKVFEQLGSFEHPGKFEHPGNNGEIKWNVEDGDTMVTNQVLCELKGNARALLTGERSALNFLQSLSSTATITNQYVQKMNNPNCKLLDTRKTIPGMRFGQKYAVTCGGGTNHRLGLSDAYLIKENHIMACGGIKAALAKAIELHPDKLLEIEVENLDELMLAIEGKAQVIMLDNFELDDLRKSVEIRNASSGQFKLEASGNVNLETISEITKTGVDFISVGAITKDVKAIDLSLRIFVN